MPLNQMMKPLILRGWQHLIGFIVGFFWITLKLGLMLGPMYVSSGYR